MADPPKPAEKKPPEPRELFKLDCDRQLMVARFTACGRMLVAGGYDASIRRWDLCAEETGAHYFSSIFNLLKVQF